MSSKAYRGSRGIAPFILYFDSRQSSVVSFTIRPPYPQRSSLQCSLNKRLSGVTELVWTFRRRNNVKERSCKQFKLKPQNLLGGTDKRHEPTTPRPEQLVFWPRFETEAPHLPHSRTCHRYYRLSQHALCLMKH